MSSQKIHLPTLKDINKNRLLIHKKHIHDRIMFTNQNLKTSTAVLFS